MRSAPFVLHVLEGGIRYDCSVNFRHNRATPLFEFTSEQYPMPEGTKIYAKLEYLNPGGSVKDRLGVHLLKEAMKTGKINQATTIIEPTAGNTGIGLGLAASQLGLKTIFVVPEKFSQENNS